MPGYYVVDSVLAAQGHYKSRSIAWSQGVIAAHLIADHCSEEDGKDYVVIDGATGQVVT